MTKTIAALAAGAILALTPSAATAGEHATSAVVFSFVQHRQVQDGAECLHERRRVEYVGLHLARHTQWHVTRVAEIVCGV